MTGRNDGCAGGVVDANARPRNGGEEDVKATAAAEGMLLEEEREVKDPPGELDADEGDD